MLHNIMHALGTGLLFQNILAEAVSEFEADYIFCLVT